MSVSRREFILGAGTAALGVSVLGLAGCGNSSSSADQIIYGTIYTGVDDTLAEALVIKDGKIEYCGTADEAKKYEGSGVEVTEFEEGILIIPGLVDGHCHPLVAWDNQLNSIMFEQSDKLEDYKKKIADYIEQNPDKEGYKAKGWFDSQFENATPTADILDEICSDKPIAATDSGGHGVWCNTKAMELLFEANPDLKFTDPDNAGKDTKSVNGGVIERDSNGKAIGCFRDKAAGLPQSVVPTATKDDYIKCIEQAMVEYASIGYTSYVEAMINESTDITQTPKVEAYMQMEEEGKLPLYVHGAFIVGNRDDKFDLVQKAIDLNEQTKDTRFKVTDIKIFMDGVVEGGSAYLTEEYANKAGYFGSSGWASEEDLAELTKVIEKANEAGMAVHFHAIGDQASTNALDCIAKAAETIGIDKVRECRNVITHLQIVEDSAYAKFKEYGVIASLSPWGEKDPSLYEDVEVKYLGKERAEKEYPIKTFFDNDVNCAFGSDYGSSFTYKFNVCYHALLTRTDVNLDPETTLNPSECITPVQALQLMSQGGAYQMKLENEIGTLEAGKMATLVVLDQNLFEIENDDTINVQSIKTMVDGMWLN